MAKRPVYDDWDSGELGSMISSGWSKKEIADYFDSSSGTVTKAIKYYGLGRERKGVHLSSKEANKRIDQLKESLMDLDFPSEILPINQDEAEEGLFIINDYQSDKTGHSIPLEIQARWNPDTESWTIEKFELRGKEREELSKKFKKSLQKKLK